MSDRPELKQAPGTLDGNTWAPPPASPQPHDETRLQPPDVQHDLGPNTPGQLGGEPSVGWETTE